MRIWQKNQNWSYSSVVNFLMICLFGPGLITTVRAQNPPYAAITEKIAITYKSATAARLLKDLDHQTSYDFIYQEEVFKKIPLAGLPFSNTTLGNALVYLNKEAGLAFSMNNKTIAVKQANNQAAPKRAPGKITGKIIDEENGQIIIGATIRIANRGITSGIDGSFSLPLPQGSYTAIISSVGYSTKEVSEITVQNDEISTLNVTLKRGKGQLAGIVVRSSAKKESVNALLARQKNAAEVSNGISAEEMGRTPDKNIGESLKRISGVSTVENKFVIVRGIGERYNAAVLDGVVLPSTEAQTRSFSFDLIPSSLVDNVIVSKTVTPDMNASFGGGLVQINTKDIPLQNFTTIAAGTSYNDQSTGKDFLSHKRGQYDYLGISDKQRKFPDNVYVTDRTVAPNTALSNEEYQQKVLAQSKRFTNDNFTVYKYKAAPSQNYQFTMGRLWKLDTTGNKLGFTGSLSYRNSQETNVFDQQRRGDWLYASNNHGASYRFNTTIGSLINVGLQVGKNRFSFRNTFTHLYDNTLVRTIGYDADNGPDQFAQGLPPGRIQETDDPTYTTLLQNKLSGQHQLGKLGLEWNIARTGVDRKEKDLSIATQGIYLIGKTYEYFYITSREGEPRINPSSRHNYQNKENHYSWGLDGNLPFSVGSMHNTMKMGYFGTRRNASFDWQIAALSGSNWLPDSLRYVQVSEMANPANFGPNGYNYNVAAFFVDSYEGKSTTEAAYLMFDSRLLQQLRLVWGVRAEYYKYTEIKNGRNQPGDPKDFHIPRDKDWQWLPSANLTYSPLSQLNIRAAFSSSVIRPELMDNSQFFKYNPFLGAPFGNQGLASTRINSYDVKAEWFPGAGELLSAGAFYKEFDKPIELDFIQVNGNINYYQRNASNAKVHGLEFELRKNMGFISANSQLLNNITAYGNLTLQKSSVLATYRIKNPAPGATNDIDVAVKQSRTMYGQSPYLVNAGIQYLGERLSLNVVYNKSGLKTYIVSSLLHQIEYEAPREQVDAQVSYKMFRKKLEVKLNAGNLLNSVSMFFANTGSYEINPDRGNSNDPSDAYRLKDGFSNNYENGDQIRFRQKFGRTYSTTLTYTF
ncbi:TonB-dependent receptor [uncultured Chitinophaga sp.]|uniref:TonB-dependent receptor n=1 Tax=uncultured Chitinophaga sp. TaxID=339340 RepID=UPI0025E3FF29|nr:TonB-dependent receptor [uncultured Chitinophaga sp.]